jgi:hypothetical protein
MRVDPAGARCGIEGGVVYVRVSGLAFTRAGDRFLNLPQPSARPRRSSSGMTATRAATPARAGWSVLCHALAREVTKTLSVEHSLKVARREVRGAAYP